MRPKEIEQLLMKHLESGSGDDELGSILIEGPPGVGKTELVSSVVKTYNKQYGENSAGFVGLSLTLYDPTDLRGFPCPDLVNKNAVWLPPSILPNEKSPNRGILFFDDLTTAPSLVQAAAYQLIIKPHKLGEYILPQGWCVVGACNRISDRALVHKIPKPLANRFIHVDFEYNLEDWTSWAIENDINPLVTGFLQSPAAYYSNKEGGDGHLLFNFDPKRDENAFATPRSWESVSRILSKQLPISVEKQAINGTVGNSAGQTFYSFKDLFNKLPDISDILDKGNIVKFDTIDLQYAMVTLMARKVETNKHLDNAFNLLETLDTECAVLFLRLLNKNNESLIKSLMTNKRFESLLEGKLSRVVNLM